MKAYRKSKITILMVFILVSTLVSSISIPAAADRIPRILLAGDSWTAFMLAFRSYRDALDNHPELTRWIEVGNRTAVAGVCAWEILEYEDMDYFNVLTNELTKYPNIDVVVMTLGGNDILHHGKGTDPNNYDRILDIADCFQKDPASEPWTDTDECIEWMGAALEDQIGQIVDHILSIRPRYPGGNPEL